MKKIHENKYYDLSLHDECGCIVFEWKPETIQMTENDFKTGLTNFAKYGEENQCREMVVDLRKFQGHPSPEVASDWRHHDASWNCCHCFNYRHGCGCKRTDQ